MTVLRPGKETPPTIHCFMAHYSVPYGQVFRQWDTRGRLLVWVNRGEIEDLARRERPMVAPNAIDTFMLSSVPVVRAVSRQGREERNG